MKSYGYNVRVIAVIDFVKLCQKTVVNATTLLCRSAVNYPNSLDQID